jgi:uncharacterized membrane protein (UPF0127 family)
MLMMGTLAAMVVCGAVLAMFQRGMDTGVVVIDDRIRVAVEIAATPPTRTQGLSGHAPLGDDEGMLFLFEWPDKYGFWMKEMLFPLDIIWIRDGLIVDISTDVPAPKQGEEIVNVMPRETVDAVLEVNAGFAARHGLRLGLPVEVR